jgi:tRNA-intron endonuclease
MGNLNLCIKNKNLKEAEIKSKLNKIDKNFNLKYAIFKDLRKKGYIVKAGLKYGADFRIYDKVQTINENHARWLVFCLEENKKIDWKEITAKARISHSSNKKLLLAILDSEGDISYYEFDWRSFK